VLDAFSLHEAVMTKAHPQVSEIVVVLRQHKARIAVSRLCKPTTLWCNTATSAEEFGLIG
jgi:hypothetical protein